MTDMGSVDIQLKERIMRRVYIVAFMRRFLRPLVVKSVFLALFSVLGLSFVSVTNVIKNALESSHGLSEVLVFIVRALTRTELVVQILFLGIVILGVWLVLDAVRDLDRKRVVA